MSAEATNAERDVAGTHPGSIAMETDALDGMAEISKRQHDVAQALRGRSPKLAGLYLSALRMLASSPEEGCEAARISMICHCMRELMSGLPAVLADTAIPRPNPSSGALASQLQELVSRRDDVDLSADQDLVPVPKEVALAVAALVQASAQEKGRNQMNAAALVTGQTDANHPAVGHWQRAYDFFLGWTHLDRNHERNRELPRNDELVAEMRVVEDVILVRTALFFQNLRAVEVLLVKINVDDSADGAAVGSPSQGDVEEALRLIPSFSLRRAFYEGLRNPWWVEPLRAAGAFQSPPEPQVDEGLIRDVYWPEIDYLVRVAGEVPDAVVEVLLTLRASNNAWVRRGTFAIGAAIPAAQAARLKPLIRAWWKSGLGWRTDPDDLVACAVNLLRGGQRGVGRWFADLLFRPRRSEQHGKPRLALDEHSYAADVTKVTSELGPGELRLVLGWLISYERIVGHLTPESDITYISRESVRDASDHHARVEAALIDAVRDLSLLAMEMDAAGTMEMLLGSGMLLARKIALYSLSQVIRQAADSGQVPGTLDRLHKLATSALQEEQSLADSCRIEYGYLARASASASGSPLEYLATTFASAVDREESRIRDWLVRQADGNPSDDGGRVQEGLARWQHLWLATIGADALPAELRDRLAELDEAYGIIDAPLRLPGRMGGWSGPNSPLSQDEMAAMTPSELASHLETWHSEGDGFGPEPTHVGQARELTSLIATNPALLKGCPDLVQRLRPIYLAAILRGWEAALKAEIGLDWMEASGLISSVLAHDDSSPFPLEGGDWHDEGDFRGAKRAAVGLLEQLATKRVSNPISEGEMRGFARLLIDQGSDETAWKEYINEREGAKDPLAISLNAQWPIRVRGLIKLMAHGKDSPWYTDSRSVLEFELEREDTRYASRAVLGENLARLVNVDPDWLNARSTTFFGSEASISASQQVALTTALAVHHYHRTLFELLSPAMAGALHCQEPIIEGWQSKKDPLLKIGEWMVLALILGHQTINDPVPHEFFAVASPETRGQALGQIAWSLLHTETLDEPIRDRFADLWDERIAHVRHQPGDAAELDQFHWVVRSHKFAAAWWLPRLKEALELDPDLAAERYMIGKEIADAAASDPGGAFAVLRLLIEGRDQAGATSYDLNRNAVPVVLAAAIASGDSALQHEAEAYMNTLGERGYLSLEREVARALQGEVGAGDVDG